MPAAVLRSTTIWDSGTMMVSNDKILTESSPLSVFLVKSGSGGNRLLFRYPFLDPTSGTEQEASSQHRSSTTSSLARQSSSGSTSLGDDQPDGQHWNVAENDDALSNVFSVNPNLCGQKFEIKINNVRYVGHPMSLLTPAPCKYNNQNNGQSHNPGNPHFLGNASCIRHQHQPGPPNNTYQSNVGGDITSFNIVYALRASASYDIVDCYHDLSQRLAIALGYEERRCSYLSRETKYIVATLDEQQMESLAKKDQHDMVLPSSSTSTVQRLSTSEKICSSQESVFSVILQRSQLARDLKRVFDDLTETGIVELRLNNWIRVSFCLPHKVHRLKLITHPNMPAIGPRDIQTCLTYLRPYHGLLLLHDPKELLESMPLDASPSFVRVIKVARPERNFIDLSVDTNLTLMQIFCIVSQLVYWAKATVIYPICDSNVYAIHPLASTNLKSELVQKFESRLASHSQSLHHYLAEFSLGTSLSQLNSPLLRTEERLQLLAIVTWMLQRRILYQIHKYIILVASEHSSRYLKSQANAPRANANHQQTEQQKTAKTNIGDALIHNAKQTFDETINGGKIHNNSHHRTNGTNIDMDNGSQPASSSEFLSNHSFNQAQGHYSQSLVTSHDDSQSLVNRSPFSDNFERVRRTRADSHAYSNEDSNFGGLNSSLSSTPNSNIESVSPNPSDIYSRSTNLNNQPSLTVSSYPLEDAMDQLASDSSMSALMRAGLTSIEARNILAVPYSKNSEDLRLFIRLIPYFDGKHHIEDIMFYENLKRSQILILCDKFREVLITCHYEDIAVSQLSPYSKHR